MKSHDIHYELIPLIPAGHLVTTVLHIKHARDNQEIWLPNWIPGS